MDEAVRGLACFDISTSSKVAERPVLEWRFVLGCWNFFVYITFTSTLQILGFSAAGLPILPTTHFSNELDVIRREKLGWDEISKQSAKIVSFIGDSHFDHSRSFAERPCDHRPRRS